MKSSQIYLVTVLLFLLVVEVTFAQRRGRSTATATPSLTFDESLYQALEWRNIGPFRGGRSLTATGVVNDPLTYYFGGTGGGVWKTVDGGNTWANVSDGFLKTGSVGAIAVSESDPNVIYVGMGEACVRGVMTSSGDGVYRSTDGGETWEHLGLETTLQISRIQIHPKDPDIVFVGAQGNPYQSGNDRGVYRSTDGGNTWQLVHQVSSKAGVSDLSMDMTNPRIIYAAYWEHQRTPWQIVSGGDGSGIYKSKDGGNSWEKLEEGLPEGVMGKIGISVSRANPQRVWAIIEAEKGGLYRSEDGGRKWKLINDDRLLRARSWYYMHVFADPNDENGVWVLNAPALKSIDGGKSFTNMSTPHGDNHDLWINPVNSDIMINANDGGANISLNGGVSWSTQANQPTVQFYRVNTDNQFPYWVYGGQQDNSSVGIPSRASGGGIGLTDWIQGVGGCESAYTAFDKDNPRYIYAGCYQGIITEWDRQTRESKSIMAYAFLGLGTSSREGKYRFNWNAPIHVSYHDPKVIYHAANVLLKSTDRGRNWTEISPDLTRNDTTKQGWGGSPITNEGAGGEVYGTIMYMAESPHDPQTLWTGSDDGLVHITRDGGRNWTIVTPPGIGETMINSIEVSPHSPSTAFLAVTGYKMGDFEPHIYKTIDYGKNWARIVNGIPAEHYVRVVREDPGRAGLLYAGTERGLFISFDGGVSWRNFQLNLPIVPITDLQVAHNDLVAATQGRSFWILDDITPLHTLATSLASGGPHLFKPDNTYRTSGAQNKNANKSGLGMNPYHGVELRYLMQTNSKDDSTEFKVEFIDASGTVLRTFRTSHPENQDTVSFKKGMNVVRWDLRTSKMDTPKGLRPFGNTGGYSVSPGDYVAKLTYGEASSQVDLKVLKDPRYEATPEGYNERQRIILDLDEMIQDLYTSVIELYSIRDQIKQFKSRFEKNMEAEKGQEAGAEEYQELIDAGDSILDQVKALEGRLVQPEQKTFQDVINFPNKLDAHILHLRGSIDGNEPPVTGGEKKRFEDLKSEWAGVKTEIEKLIDQDLREYNALLGRKTVPHIAPVKN